jgi:putative flippase GtrA
MNNNACNYTPELRRIIEHKQREMKEKGNSDAVKAYSIIKKFIIDNELVVYGGVALNTILPDNLKFYGPYDSPDFDCMSNTAKKHAQKLADILYENGFVYTEVKEAVHKGTYKIFVNFTAVADITQIASLFYDTIVNISLNERNLFKHIPKDERRMHIAPMYLLKYFSYKELSRPEGSLHRWSKLYMRSKLLNGIVSKSYPLTHPNKLVDQASFYEESLRGLFMDCLDIVKDMKLPLIGNFAIGVLLDKNKGVIDCCRMDPFFSVFEVLSMNILETAEKIVSMLDVDKTMYKVVLTKRFFYHDILPRRMRIFLKDLKSKRMISLMTVISTEEECYSYIERNGLILGSPNTILQFLYAYWLVYYVYEKADIAKKVVWMIAAMEEYVWNKSPPQERFSTQCYGKQKTYIDISKERWNNKVTFCYRPGEKKRNRA